MLRKLGKKAQSTAEYAILIAIVVGAIVAMQVYVRRGLQARVRDVVDNVEGDIFTGGQYEPYYAASEAATGRGASTQEILGTGGVVGRASADTTQQVREQVSAWDAGDTANVQPTPTVTTPSRPGTPSVPREQ